MLNFFLHAYWPSTCPLWKMFIRFFCPFFNCLVYLFICLILTCMSLSYIWDINPLSVISFANIFSYSVGCIFILWMVSFAAKNLLSLIRSHLFGFAFTSFALIDRSTKKIVGGFWADECKIWFTFWQGYFCYYIENRLWRNGGKSRALLEATAVFPMSYNGSHILWQILVAVVVMGL